MRHSRSLPEEFDLIRVASVGPSTVQKTSFDVEDIGRLWRRESSVPNTSTGVFVQVVPHKTRRSQDVELSDGGKYYR